MPGRAAMMLGTAYGTPLDRLQRGAAALSRLVEAGLLVACAGLLVVLTANVFLEVMIRYVVSAPLPWTEEVARFALVWFGMLSAAAAARRGLHFAFRWGVMPLPEAVQRVLRQAVNLGIVAFLAVMLWQAWAFLDIVAGQTALASGLDMRLPYAGLVAGLGGLLAIYLLELVDGALAPFTGRRLSLKEAAEEEALHQIEHPEEVPHAVPLVGAE